MFNRPKVSLAGRLIITLVFVLTVFAPEIWMLIAIPKAFGILSLVRITGEAILYYFTMLGHGSARWITAFLLIASVAIAIGAAGRRNPPVAIAVAIIFIPSIAILLGMKAVRLEEPMRSRRRRAHS